MDIFELFEPIQLEEVKNLNDPRRQLFLWSMCFKTRRDSRLED
jgi:hypothetical protein